MPQVILVGKGEVEVAKGQLAEGHLHKISMLFLQIDTYLWTCTRSCTALLPALFVPADPQQRLGCCMRTLHQGCAWLCAALVQCARA